VILVNEYVSGLIRLKAVDQEQEINYMKYLESLGRQLVQRQISVCWSWSRRPKDKKRCKRMITDIVVDDIWHNA